MRRNTLCLATSLLVVSSVLAEVHAHGHSDGAQQTASGENTGFFRHINDEQRSQRRGGWYRFFRSPRNRSYRPTAEADSATTTVDTATTIDLLANDTGTGLKLKNLFTNTQAGGTVTSNGGGVSYTPPAGFTGIDEFWYVVTDTNGHSAAAKVTVDVSGTASNTDNEIIDQDPLDQDITEQGQMVPDEFIEEGSNPDADPANPSFINMIPGGLTDTPAGQTTAGVKCDYNEDNFNATASVAANSKAAWSCNESERMLSANGLPDHEVGTFPSDDNPNTITEQTISTSFPLTPTKTEFMNTPDVIAYALNGVRIDAVTTGSCNLNGDDCSVTDDSGFWNIEALGQTRFDFGSDESNGYVKADGVYRYHGMPEGFLRTQGASDAVMTLIGWAADGFPIYGRHGHSIADDAESDLKVISGSYQPVEETDATRPSVDTYALGTFTQDWRYVAGSGDLDECNGRVGVTPEFPNGIYHYFATDSYPYVPRCVKGEIENTGMVGVPTIPGVPDATEIPGATEIPDGAETPVTEPDSTTEPDNTPTPDVAVPPEFIGLPGFTEQPDGTETPDVTEIPDIIVPTDGVSGTDT